MAQYTDNKKITTHVNIEKIEIRHLKANDYLELKDSMIEAYPAWPSAFWREDQINALLSRFPDGQIAVAVNDVVVGCALSLIVDYDQFGDDHTYKEITGEYSFNTHDPKGDVLYGIDVFIRPEYRGMRLARRLYDARKELCEKLNLKNIVIGGRIPKYHEQADTMSPKEYIHQVKHRLLFDPVLTFQIANDFHVNKVVKNYLEGDFESREYAVILEWSNIYYSQKKRKAVSQKSIVRLGLIQWQMRQYKDIDDLFTQVEYFVEAVAGYKCDFALFPEFFNAPLMAKYNHLPEVDAIRSLAQYTEDIRERFSKLAISYNCNIITGSMPAIEEGKLHNVGYLCHRDGRFDKYEKIHVTPDELRLFGLVGGNKIEAFSTDCGKVGILICYDSEFPELSRILADQGMDILFVPFLTDTQNGYSRVRNCCQARAIENECFVAIAGSVGNLPNVHNMDIQFAQSVVFTPCDFSFPTGGIKAEATANTEMILIADVDLNLLKELHEYGSVNTLKDRRKDLYEIRLLNENGK